MYTHAPKEYNCPICIAVRGEENEQSWIVQNDIFYKDDVVMGFISSKTIAGNAGHALLVPIAHTENLYDLSEETGHRLFDLTKTVARAIKELRQADGVTVVQNNEPAGDQHAFHYHVHLIPRFDGDSFHEEFWEATRSTPEDRYDYAQQLRQWFELKNQID